MAIAHTHQRSNANTGVLPFLDSDRLSSHKLCKWLSISPLHQVFHALFGLRTTDRNVYYEFFPAKEAMYVKVENK